MDREVPAVVDDAVAMARRLFLESDNEYGCAETTFLVLTTAFGLEDVSDPSTAMALNGGVAYWGGICGAVSGAALAVGLLAGRRMGEHRAAKRVARGLIDDLMGDFRSTYGAVDCRDLIGLDLRAPGAHDAFLAAGTWRDRCMAQIEFTLVRVAPLAEDAAWDRAVARIERASAR